MYSTAHRTSVMQLAVFCMYWGSWSFERIPFTSTKADGTMNETGLSQRTKLPGSWSAKTQHTSAFLRPPRTSLCPMRWWERLVCQLLNISVCISVSARAKNLFVSVYLVLPAGKKLCGSSLWAHQSLESRGSFDVINLRAMFYVLCTQSKEVSQQ